MDKLLLIVATSGRMLAEFACRSGFSPLVIDVFADQDTRKLALETRQVESLDEESLLPSLTYFQKKYAVQQVVYGSGFENSPNGLSLIEEKFLLLGNDSYVFQKLLNKEQVFADLVAMKIPHPQVTFSAPVNPLGWLTKPISGEGGVGIRFFDKAMVNDRPVYWQRYIAGQPKSVLFIADGKNAQLIGFHRQWVCTGIDNQPFIFSGILNHAQLNKNQQITILHWVAQLTVAYGLRGLNCLDLLHAENQLMFLEINPRPSASMMLYDADLLALHIQGCQGQKINRVNTKLYKAYQVLYADKHITIRSGLVWPEWSQDRPNAGVLIRPGQAICSIISSGHNAQQVCAQLLVRQQIIFNLIKGREHYAKQG